MNTIQYLKETFYPKRIPCLDGLRAISVLFVVFGHIILTNKSVSLKIKQSFIYQDIGVSLFFVISGYLITNILLGEFRKNGRISLYNFFIKRLFRIFPAYYLFLIICQQFAPFFGIVVSSDDLFATFFYIGFYYPKGLVNIFAHSWSLAIEEQFYLMWAPLLSLFKFNIKKTIVILILLGPLIRILTYLFIPILKNRLHFLFHTRMDTLMFGCLLSFMDKQSLELLFYKYFKKDKTALISLIYLFVAHPLLYYFFQGTYRATVGYTIEGFLLMGLVYYFVQSRETVVTRILNSKLLVHLGSISYGIYLWQQPLTYIHKAPFSGGVLNLLLIYVFALCSYLFFEKPILNYRKIFLR